MIKILMLLALCSCRVVEKQIEKAREVCKGNGGIHSINVTTPEFADFKCKNGSMWVERL